MAMTLLRGRPSGHTGMAGSPLESVVYIRILKYNQLDQASHSSVGRKVEQRQGEGGSLS